MGFYGRPGRGRVGRPVERRWDDYLRRCAVSRPILEAFVAGPGWACFDPELGYLLRDSAIAWGVDGSLAVETFDDDGGREALRYPGRRPRINSYGDELTEGMQVNDGETWQEYLSARLREPVGNYGVGGYGVYQSYRRMIREESARPAAPVIVLGVTGPAMVRSVTRSHWVTTATLQWRDLGSGRPVFHGNPWPSLEMDLEAGELVERENPLRTPDSLLAMADPEWMVHAFHDDLASRLLGFSRGFVADVDRRATERLAEILGTRVAWDDPRTEADRVLNLYGQTATIAVLDRTADFVASRGGRLLVVLDFTAGPPGDGSTRDDDRVLAHLTAGGFAVVDVNDAHRREAATSLLSWEEYLARYVVAGNPDSVLHYNPRGNHFFAYAVKDGLIGLLDRKPAPYRARWARAVATRDRTAVGQPDLAGRDAWIAPVLRELGARFADPWDADSLTRLARRSRSAFYRDFLAVMKVSPMEYVKRLRLDEAARLFVTGDATIAAVAGHIGFGSPFHLSREFTRRFGVSPSEYRRSAREDLARQA